MNKQNNDNLICEELTKQDFEFADSGRIIRDEKLITRPVGYYKDAWRRFKKNKASVVAAIIILALILFSLIVPIFASIPLNFYDGKYRNMKPKNELLSKIGIFTGVKSEEKNTRGFYRLLAIGAGAEDKDGTKYNNLYSTNKFDTGNTAFDDGVGSKYAAVVSQPKIIGSDNYKDYFFDLDTYNEVGFEYITVTTEVLDDILAYEEETGVQIIYPMIDALDIDKANENTGPNVWYRTVNSEPVLDEYGNFINIYQHDDEGNVVFYEPMQNGSVRLRVLYSEYFTYKNGFEPVFFLGTNSIGQDLLIRLAVGIRTSMILSVIITTINLLIGMVYGSISGYYGGTTDLLMERVREILGGMPLIVIVMLFKVHFLSTGKVGPIATLILVFVVLGWLGAAGLVRRQFYRFKNQEYVLAARTLGAKDLRIMARHIFPNGIGTIITASILSIPSFVFGEATLSYLGILDVSGPNAASLGAMLASGQASFASFPHIILWPSIVISLLMLSFNLFGNGLRDAFNPTLRGSDGE